MPTFCKWNGYLQMKRHTVENKVTATNTAARGLTEVGTGCARYRKDICGREEMTSFLPRDRAIQILKDGRMRKGKGHLERWVDEGQTFRSDCKPTWKEQAAFQKQTDLLKTSSYLWRKRNQLHFTFTLEKCLLSQQEGDIQENKQINRDICRNCHYYGQVQPVVTVIVVTYSLIQVLVLVLPASPQWLQTLLHKSHCQKLTVSKTAKTVILIDPFCFVYKISSLEIKTVSVCVNILVCTCTVPDTTKLGWKVWLKDLSITVTQTATKTRNIHGG